MSNKNKLRITKKIKIAKLMASKPCLHQVLVEKYGMHCFGCTFSTLETLEQGAKAHGMSNKQIKKMVKELNRKISNS